MIKRRVVEKRVEECEKEKREVKSMEGSEKKKREDEKMVGEREREAGS